MLAKTKAIQLLQTLTAKEVEEFSDHLDLFASKSAAFLKEIVIWCAGFHPQFDQPGFTKEKLLQRLQKRKPVNQDKLRYILSDLALALEKYVVYKNSLRGDARTHLVLLEYYKEKDLERFFNQKFEALEQILDTSASRGTDFHLIKYQACDHRYAYHLRKQREGLDDELQTTSHHLDTYYVIVRLRLFSEMLTREMLLKVTYDKPLLPAILEMASWEPYASDPVVGVYRTVIHMHLEPEREDYFEALQKYIDSSAPLIPKSELNDLLVFSQNYCTGKINQGKENFLWKIWEIYQKMIAYDVIYEGEYIRPGLLKNIVTVGIRLNQLEAAEKVVDSFGQRVEPRIREGVLGYNKAVLAFARRDYRQALRLLSQAQVDDIFYELGTRALFLKLFYELEDAVSFYHHWDAFYNFIRRNKVMSDAQKASHKNFIRIIRQLMRIRAEGDRNLGMKLREEIERQGVLDSTWFHKKLDELKIPRP